MLTKLLRSSLSGRTATAVVINVASDNEHADETLRSLEFGERMGAVRTATTRVVQERGLDNSQIEALQKEAALLRAALARMQADDLDIGLFHESAVQSEVRSLKTNIRRYQKFASAAKVSSAKLAEGAAGQDLAELRKQFANQEAEASNLNNIIEMQKTIPVVRGQAATIWQGPHPEYSRTAARLKEIEDALAFG